MGKFLKEVRKDAWRTCKVQVAWMEDERDWKTLKKSSVYKGKRKPKDQCKTVSLSQSGLLQIWSMTDVGWEERNVWTPSVVLLGAA